jgi:hypothetical protein
MPTRVYTGGQWLEVDLLPQPLSVTATPAFAGLLLTGNLTVGGNLVVNGTTVTLNSTTVTIDDPIFTLGGDTAPTVDDNKDRGIEFKWHNGVTAKVGFFGFDDSTGKFTFIPDATNTSEVFSGTKGELDANVDWVNILNKPDPVVTVTLTGDVTGTANTTLTDVGNGTISVATTIQPNSVALGTDTTGDYVATVTGTTNQITSSVSTGESAAVVLSLPQNIHTAATPTFSSLTLSSTGTSLTANGDMVVRGGNTFWDASFASNGSTDLNWKVVATVGTPTGLYVGAEFEVDVLFKADNYASLSTAAPFKQMTFGLTIKRSDGVQDDTDAGAVWGPVAEYVRLVRVDIANWEIQVRQPNQFQIVRWRIRRLVHNNTTITWGTGGFAGLANGNLVGTTYVANTTYKYEHLFSKIDAKYAFIQPWVASESAVVVKGIAAQTADLEQWQDSTGSVMVRIAAGGGIGINGPMINTGFGLSLTNKPIGYQSTDNTSNLISVINIARGNSTGAWMGIGSTGDAANGVAKIVISNSSNVEQVSVSQAGVLTMATNSINFGSRLNQHLNLYSATYGIGIQTAVMYLRTNSGLAVYAGGIHADGQWAPGTGGTELLRIDTSSFQYKNQNIWRDGITSVAASASPITNLNADLLDGVQGADYASRTLLEALLGDLLYVGLHDPTAYDITNVVLTSSTVTVTTATAHGYSVGKVVGMRVGKVAVTNKAATGTVATLTTAAAHGLLVGQQVYVAGVGATSTDGFDGTFTIASVPTSTTLTYASTATSLASTACTGNLAPAAYYGSFTITAVPTTTTFSYAFSSPNITTAATTGTTFRLPMPTWNGASTDYRNGMYWIVKSTGQMDYLDSDLSGRLDTKDSPENVFNGDWVIASDPAYNPTTPNVNRTLSAMLFQLLPFSTETLIKQRIAEHATDAADPHSAARYLLRNPIATLSQLTVTNKALTSNVATLTTSTPHGFNVDTVVYVDGVDSTFNGTATVTSIPTTTTFTFDRTATNVTSVAATGTVGARDDRRYVDDVFSKIGHVHTQEIESAIADHASQADPHTVYLLETVAADTYALKVHRHDELYEPLGAVANHVNAADPHPQYLTTGEGNALYAPVVHNHNDLYYSKSQVDAAIAAIAAEVYGTDLAPSHRVFIGYSAPTAPAAGDIWIETLINPSQLPPAAPASFTATVTSSSVTLVWPTWPSSAGTLQTSPNGVRLDWTTNSAVATSTGAYAASASAGWVNIGTVANNATSFLHNTGLTENTTYYYRLQAVNNATAAGPTGLGSTSGAGAFAFVSAKTSNAAPGAPTALTTSAVSATQITLSWTAPTSFPDPNASPYEVYLNGSSVATVSGTTYTFTGLTENTTYSMGVRSRDSGGADIPVTVLTSSIATISNASTVTTPATITRTGNAAPPTPTSLATSGVTHNAATLSWAAGAPITANGHPSTGITDFATYRIYKDGSAHATTTSTSFTFSFSSTTPTTYVLGVRAEDASGAQSSLVTASITTSANPDVTPPDNPTITSFQPEGSYGAMVLRGTWATTTVFATIQKSTNGSTWTTQVARHAVTAGSFSSGSGYAIGTHTAGQTVYVRTIVEDSVGNSRTSGTLSTYTLAASPTLITADASNSWRNTNGGEWNAAGNYQAYQGYFSNAAWNARGLWFYGTTPYTQLYNSGRRSVTNLRIFMVRDTAGGSAAAAPTLYLHKETANPGTVLDSTAPVAYGSATTGPALTTPAGGANIGWSSYLGATWAQGIVDGTYRGIMVYNSSGAPYLTYTAVSVNGYSGLLEFTHLG